jgi:hypothetical protein
MCFCMWRNTQQQTAGPRSNGEPRYCAVTPLEALRRLEPSHFPTAGATQLRITQPVPDDWSYYPRHIPLPDRRILHQLRFRCRQAVHGEFILSYVKTTSSRQSEWNQCYWLIDCSQMHAQLVFWLLSELRSSAAGTLGIGNKICAGWQSIDVWAGWQLAEHAHLNPCFIHSHLLTAITH